MRKLAIFFLLTVTLGIGACRKPEVPRPAKIVAVVETKPPKVRFEDATKACGIDFVDVTGAAGK
jgi:hypothetical protein